jgi:hypothetical protein
LAKCLDKEIGEINNGSINIPSEDIAGKYLYNIEIPG